MPSLERILLPVDFSERSLYAAHHARALALRFGAEVSVLHALTPPELEAGALDISGAMIADLYRGRAELAAAELETFTKNHLRDVNAHSAVVEGEPAARIVSRAQEEQSDLIIMPTHGYGRFRRFILGSNTAKVLHDADCPVWTGVHIEHNPAQTPAPFRNVLCGVDLGPQSEKALAWAAMLAAKCGAKLSLIHATGAAPGSSGERRSDIDEAAAREMERLRRAVDVEAGFVAEPGEPAAALCAAAARLEADALVIGRGSAAGVFGRLRTNAYAIIRQSPCPVVSV